MLGGRDVGEPFVSLFYALLGLGGGGDGRLGGGKRLSIWGGVESGAEALESF